MSVLVLTWKAITGKEPCLISPRTSGSLLGANQLKTGKELCLISRGTCFNLKGQYR